MKTGDVIAFSGKGKVSQIIKWKTNSQFSHVGIIMNTHMQGGVGEAVLLFESTAFSYIPDDATKEIINGVQMHFLSRRIESYAGNAWWLPLKEKMAEYQEFNMQKWLRNVHESRVKYDAVGAIGAGEDLFDWIPGIENEPDFSSLFCSELVAKALQVAGVISEDINPSEQTPADIAKFGCVAEPVALF